MTVNKLEKRPIIVYFAVVFVSTAMALASRWGWLSPLAALLFTVLYGVGIPAPIFSYLYLKAKNRLALVRPMLRCHGVAWFISVAVCILLTGAPVAGLVYGSLHYGWPGIIVFATFQWLRHKE